MIWATIAKLSGIKIIQELSEMINVIEASSSTPRYRLEITISSRGNIPRYINS